MPRPEHFCSAELLPGECLHCIGKPRPFVRIICWASRHEKVEIELLGRTPKRVRIRFLTDNKKGKRGDVRLVSPDVVVFPASDAEVSS